MKRTLLVALMVATLTGPAHTHTRHEQPEPKRRTSGQVATKHKQTDPAKEPTK